MVDGARPSRRATARSGSPTDSPRLISSRSASDKRDGPGDHKIWLDSRLPRARTTYFTVEREYPISAAISRIVLPSRRSLRAYSRCCSVRCGAKETSRSSQLTVVDSPRCCADPLSPPREKSRTMKMVRLFVVLTLATALVTLAVPSLAGAVTAGQVGTVPGIGGIGAGTATRAQPRCSASPEVAAKYVIPPPPFRVRTVTVQRMAMPPGEPKGKGPNFKRLYRVSFYVVEGNAVLPAGHRYTQFAYVSRQSTRAAWCFLKGGSGP